MSIEEKKKLNRHKWEWHSASKATCKKCGAYKNKSFIPVSYRDSDGVYSKYAPDCKGTNNKRIER
jgi:hypothetical protein